MTAKLNLAMVLLPYRVVFMSSLCVMQNQMVSYTQVLWQHQLTKFLRAPMLD